MDDLSNFLRKPSEWKTQSKTNPKHNQNTIQNKSKTQSKTNPKQQEVRFSSVAQSYPTFCDPMDCSMPGLPVHCQLPELALTQVHWISDAIQSSNPLPSPSPPAFSLSQHQGLFQWISSSHQVTKVSALEFQLQHQSFQWIFRTNFF